MRLMMALFILIPALEIALFVLSGQTIGIWLTVALIMMTGIGGAWLTKRQGLALLQQANRDLSDGRLPGGAVLDGICVLAGGLLLLTPGFLTDALGLLLLVPATRALFKPALARWLKSWFETRTFFFIGR